MVTNVNRRTGPNNPGFQWAERGSAKSGQKTILNRLHILRRFQKAGTPLREHRRNFIGILFRDKIIEAAFLSQEKSVERPRHLIVRMKVIFARR
jgi:hypothetical protein